jgi:hypothetical protein
MKPQQKKSKPTNAREPLEIDACRDKYTSPELQTLVNAVVTYVDEYDSHDGSVDLVLSLTAFDDNGDLVEDRMLLIGTKNILTEFQANRILKRLEEEPGEDPYLDCEYWYSCEPEVIN